MCEKNIKTDRSLEILLNKYMTRCAMYERALCKLAFDPHFQNEQAEASDFAKSAILKTQ